MAKSVKKVSQLPDDTIFEIVSVKCEQSFKKEMTYIEALNIDKKKGWRYIIYQKGFS